MRKLVLTTVTAAVLLGVSTPAQAVTPTIPATSTVTTAAGATSTGSSSDRTQALGTPVAREAPAAYAERRRTRRRGGIGRLFGGLAFLFIGIPLLIVLALVIAFALRRSRRSGPTPGANPTNIPAPPREDVARGEGPTYRPGPDERR